MLSIPTANMITYLIFQLATEIKYISLATRRTMHVNRGNVIMTSLSFTLPEITGFSHRFTQAYGTITVIF